MAIDNPDPAGLLQLAMKHLGQPIVGLRIAELGDQFVKWPSDRRILMKHVCELMGAVHVSFDINGKGGAVPVDLGRPLEQSPSWFEGFDLVTNFGTSEHVESGPMAQYWCFRNVEALCRVGGVMIHYVPSVRCSRHGAYHYTCGFFRRLALAGLYETLLVDERQKWNRRIADPAQQTDHYIMAALVKTRSSPAMSKDEFPALIRHDEWRRAHE